MRTKNPRGSNEIYLTRHAKAEHNIKEGFFAGGRTDTRLSDTGKKEVVELARQIAKLGNSIKTIFCSQLVRSRETAEIIAREIRRNGFPAKIIEISGLNEVNVGEFTGKSGEAVKRLYPKEAASFYEGNISNWNFPKGENFEKLCKRAKTVFAYIKKTVRPHEGAIIVGHAMFNRTLLYLLYPKRKNLWQPIIYPHNTLIPIKEKLFKQK
ncbi:MAG: histidine phosphatase family protein [Candidatus Berkelbacteria bacterium]|nr:histidine phosphatase family protein [Candidatus Berkelbacteria bacterium]